MLTPKKLNIPVIIENSVAVDHQSVRATITIPSASPWTKEEVASFFNKKGLNLDAIFRTSNKAAYTAFISKAKEAIQFEEASVHGISKVGNNIFHDDEDNIWEMVDTASGKMLIKKTDIASTAILESLKARGEIASVTVHRSLPMEEKTSVGDYIIWFDTNRGKQRTGFVTNNNLAFDIKNKELSSFLDKQVICVVTDCYSIQPTQSKETASKIYSYNKELFDTINDTALNLVKVA